MNLPAIRMNGFFIKPLPKKVLSLVGDRLEKELKRRGLRPESQITNEVLFTPFRILANALKYHDDYVYEFQFIQSGDINVITFELYVSKLGLKNKVCVMSERMNLQNYTAAGFMQRFKQIVIDSNETIDHWNKINQTTPVTFYSRPPLELFYQLFHNKLKESLYLSNQKLLDGFRTLETLQFTDEVRFGDKKEWTFSTSFIGNADWGIVQYWINHKAFKNISFVLGEFEGDFYNYYDPSNIYRMFELSMDKLIQGMKQWNIFIEQNEVRGVNKIESISIEEYATAPPRDI